MNITKLSLHKIQTMPYTDFVGLIAQWNVPPGSYSTLSQWKVFGNISSTSTIYEAATTTGFSLRELALMTGSSGIGVDISEKSINTAITLKAKYAPSARINYTTSDALTFKTEEKFSHVIVGAALRFFPDPIDAVRKLTEYLQDDGIFLSTEFYSRNVIPRTIVDEAKSIFDITVTQEKYKNVMKPYQSLTLLYESRNIPELETEGELEFYCRSTIDRFFEEYPEATGDHLDAMYKRLMSIKRMSNQLREYQGYNVLVHKKDSRYYPRRYTELF